jgi:hypothetical protein
VKLIESLKDLQSWEDYKEFLKVQLKLLEGPGEPFFVSKERIAFDLGGKPWNGFAFLTGPKGTHCKRKLVKEGVLFREGSCTRQGKELLVDGLEPRLVKEAGGSVAQVSSMLTRCSILRVVSGTCNTFATRFRQFMGQCLSKLFSNT